MAFLSKLKSKAQGVLQSSPNESKNENSSNPGQQPWTHNGKHLNFSASHLRSQNASLPQPSPPSDATIRTTIPWPPKLKSKTYHPPLQFLSPTGRPHAVLRDLGFSSLLAGRIIWTWGDTLMGTPDKCMICAADSTSIGTLESKEVVLDSAMEGSNERVSNWINCLPHEEADGGLGKYAFGGTNIVEFPPGSGEGVVYYLKNSRPGGVSRIMGAGIARVSIGEDNIPHSDRVGETLWSEDEPWYGDVGAVFNALNSKIYVYGHGPAWDSELNSRTFLARVSAGQATDINAYEYWLNSTRSWTAQRQSNGSLGTAKLSPQDAIFDWHVMNQSTPFWNVYFKKWMFIHGSSWPDSDVLVRTADALEGPWADHGSVCTTAPNGDEKGFRYCITPHPEYDSTGKTVWVTWTRENVIWGVTIEWE